MTRTILVTGGAGFIGSNFVQMLREDRPTDQIINLDSLTYAGNLENLKGFDDAAEYSFVHGDITVADDVKRAFDTAGQGGVSHVVHFAAESHVDRSIESGLPFVQSNVVGTQVLLDEARSRGVERFVHVSTDEVYGSLGKTGFFTEDTPLSPNSPYSASKAGSDMLVRAAIHTHDFPALITRCSNNYGPYQFPEKLIPLMIANAREGKPLPVYGDGMQIRDWLYVRDHCEAILAVMEKGALGEVYNIGGHNEYPNIDIVKSIISELSGPEVGATEDLIEYVKDRPGHDRRYAIDAGKIQRDLGWTPRFTFEQALPMTIKWYLENDEWLQGVRSGSYRDYYERQYGASQA